jgi:hypothetical protein
MRSLSAGGVRLPKFIAPRASAGGAPGFLLGMSIAAAMMGGVLVSCPASAHTTGMSTASFDVQPDGRIDARLVFASAEPLRGTPLRDEDLRAFVLDGVEVTADGTACTPTFRDAEGDDRGDLVLEASYACPAPASEIGAIEVTLYYLSALGPAHREVARVTAGSATSEAVLSGDHRAIALRLSGGTRRTKGLRRGRLLVAVTAAFAALMGGLFVWRWRATRKAGDR